MKRILTTLALSLSIVSAFGQNFNNDFIKLGQKAPDLATKDPSGKMLRLSEINKGSYVMLDFWASWCGPCRHANPGLVRMSNEYSGKKFKNAKNGFRVISYSLDMNKEAWINAIKHDGLVWPYQMADLPTSQWGSAVTGSYGIQYIPQAFLIGPDGKIIGKYNTAEEGENDLKKYLAQ